MDPLLQDLIERSAQLSEEQKVQLAELLQRSLNTSEPTHSPDLTGSSGAHRVAPGEAPSSAPPLDALALLGRVELFRVLDEEQRRELAGRMEEVVFSAGAFIVEEGTRDNCLYLLDSGGAEVRVTVEGSNITKPVARLEAGDFFGEMALLTGEPRRASVIAHLPVRCFRLRREDFDALVRARPELIDDLAGILARRLVELRAVREEKFSLFDSIPEAEREALVACMEELTFGPGETIVREGARDEWMGILIRGEAEVRVAEEGGRVSRRVATLQGGDFFGEMSLLSGEPRAATIVARTPIHAYRLDREVFEDRYLREFPHMRERLEGIIADRRAVLRSVRTGLEEDVRLQQVRVAETSLRRRIRRFFSLDRPAAAGKLLAEEAPRSASGRLLFEYPTPSGQDKPLHNVYVELWHRDVIEVFLGCATTARDGTFELWYDVTDLGGRANLELRVFESHHTYSPEGELRLRNDLVFTLEGEKGVREELFDFGELRVPYWEYDPTTPIPRALIVEQGDPPQEYSPGRSMFMVKMNAPMEVVKRKHMMEFRFTKGAGPSIEKIQRDYPENLTMRLERERPGYTRSDEYFGERLLNGMSASVFDRDEHNPNQFRLYHHWNSYEHDGIHAMPNVDMRFEVREGKLYPVRITLWLRKPGVTEPNALTEKLTFTPEDGERWMQAKRIARVSAAVVGEMDNHLATTHLNTEQYAIAAYRNLRKNPIRYLLFPHIKEVVLIDHRADSFLLGPTGFVTRATALTGEAFQQRIAQVLGTLDWKNWRPIQPICEAHSYAKVANLFWEVLTEFVDDFFEEHAEEIADYWYEVHLFSQDLVEHSVPDFLCRYLSAAVGGRPEQARSWFTPEERMDLSIPRYVVNGVPRAVRPVTLSNLPMPGDIEDMKQVCRDVIYHATFKHTWANARQYDDVGEIVYNSLGIRYGENGPFGPESDSSIAPPPDIATEQLRIGRMLSTSVYGYITRNEDNDIHPAFIDLLQRRRGEFEALGFDIDTIQSRTNI